MYWKKLFSGTKLQIQLDSLSPSMALSIQSNHSWWLSARTMFRNRFDWSPKYAAHSNIKRLDDNIEGCLIVESIALIWRLVTVVVLDRFWRHYIAIQLMHSSSALLRVYASLYAVTIDLLGVETKVKEEGIDCRSIHPKNTHTLSHIISSSVTLRWSCEISHFLEWSFVPGFWWVIV